MIDITYVPLLDSDEIPLLTRIYGSTRMPELAQTGWTDEQKDAFIRHQFHAQHTYYRHQVYPDADDYLLLQGDTPICRLDLERNLIPGTIRIIDITLLPEFHNQGIGRHILTQVQEEARSQQKSVSIHVERFNPAFNLYTSLGFKTISDFNEVYIFMEWMPEPID